MEEKKILYTDRAAELGGPYSQAVVYNDMIYLSGQGAVDPLTNQVCYGTIEEETDLTMKNIRMILEAAGSSMEKILQVRAYLLDMREYARFNAAYERHFPCDPPVRTCVQAAGLPFGIRVEIDAVAYL